MSEITNSSKVNSSKSLRLTTRIIGTLWIVICLTLIIGYYIEGLRRKSATVPTEPDIFGIFVLYGYWTCRLDTCYMCFFFNIK